MQSASCMTVYRRVDCKRPGCPPDTFTMPVMERSPIAGNFFFTPFPGRSIRDKMIANKKQANAIRHSINKDHDDSQYNLDAYDEKMDNLDAEADAIGKEKQEALRSFEEETTSMITEEINNRRLPALEAMKEEKANMENEIAAEEKRFSDQTLLIANKYAAILGEDLCRQDKLEDLIAIMQEGQADTVSEAIAVYKGQKASR